MFLQQGLSTQGSQSELIVKKFERTLHNIMITSFVIRGPAPDVRKLCNNVHVHIV